MNDKTKQTQAVAAPYPGDPVAVPARSDSPVGRASRLADARVRLGQAGGRVTASSARPDAAKSVPMPSARRPTA